MTYPQKIIFGEMHEFGVREVLMYCGDYGRDFVPRKLSECLTVC